MPHWCSCRAILDDLETHIANLIVTPNHDQTWVPELCLGSNQSHFLAKSVNKREQFEHTHKQPSGVPSAILQCTVFAAQRSSHVHLYSIFLHTFITSTGSSPTQALRKFRVRGKKNLLFQPLSAGTTNIALMVICALLSLSGFLQTLVSPESMSWTEESPRQISDRLPTQTNINQQTTVPITCLPFRTRFLLHHMVTNKGEKKIVDEIRRIEPPSAPPWTRIEHRRTVSTLHSFPETP